MRTQTISFPEKQVLCIFPEKPENLAQAMAEIRLPNGYPVIVLVGGKILAQHAGVTEQAIQTIAQVAEDIKAVIICGGTDMGVMADIGKVRSAHQYQFPLIGITLEKLVTWPGGPHSGKFLWWGTKRWQLEPHYTHFILVPGDKFGDESSWIVESATILSTGHRSVTILINGGEISKKDVELSVAHGRRVIALGGTGRLANDMAMNPDRATLITVIPGTNTDLIETTIRNALLHSD
jgi:hypothetical protein